MIFTPKTLTKKDGTFRIDAVVQAKANVCFDAPILREFWHNFTFGLSTLNVEKTDEFIFSVGNAKKLPVDGNAYAINIEPEGICLSADDEKGLLLGFMTLIDRIHAVDTEKGISAEIDCCAIKDTPLLANRMVHFCIFPETKLWELQRFLRLCGALKYTHVILEFWGMLRYDCMKELAWQSAFTKEQLRPIIREANALGLEIIPMFNHWGHASASRVRHGKHVVLDQNPALQTYFSEDGWCWNIDSQKTRSLLRAVRNELTELCGEGRYFHIGCDEAYNFDLSSTDGMDTVCNYLNEIGAELREKGRRAIVWGDMFLYRHDRYNSHNKYCCNAPSPECEQYMLSRLHKDLIMADWQYDPTQAPVETSDVFVKAGFDCLLCPWDRGLRQMNSCLATATEQQLFGLLHTTWHTLSAGIAFVTVAAVGAFDGKTDAVVTYWQSKTAALLRKVYPVNGDYQKAGWSKKQIEDIT